MVCPGCGAVEVSVLPVLKSLDTSARLTKPADPVKVARFIAAATDALAN
jgi:hypothetical protein